MDATHVKIRFQGGISITFPRSRGPLLTNINDLVLMLIGTATSTVLVHNPVIAGGPSKDERGNTAYVR